MDRLRLEQTDIYMTDRDSDREMDRLRLGQTD